MARIPLLCLAVLLFASGCAPKDPLDRKVKASTPGDFALWWDRVQVKLPEPERSEAYNLIRFLKSKTPRLHKETEHDTNDPLCKQIDGMTVRELLIFGLREHNRFNRNLIMIEMGKLAPLVNSVADAPDERTRIRSATLLTYTRDLIQSWNQTIARNDLLIAGFESRSAPPRPQPSPPSP